MTPRLPRRLSELLPPAGPAPVAPSLGVPPSALLLQPAPSEPTPPGRPHAWALACTACGVPVHDFPEFLLSELEETALLTRGIFPPSWSCKCLGGKPQACAPGLFVILPPPPTVASDPPIVEAAP